MFLFSKLQRLNKRVEYELVFKKGHKILTKAFVVYHLQNDYPKTRLGLTISKKAIRHACNRNRTKRLIRESFRCKNLPLFDVVFVARQGISILDKTEINENLQYIWKKLICIYGE